MEGRVMEFCKRFRIGKVYVYVTTISMKKRSPSERSYRNRTNRLKRLKADLYVECGGRCQGCGRALPLSELEAHHVVPRSVKPEWILRKSNIRLLCRACHANIHQGKD